MSGFMVLFRKEVKEGFRTKRVVIVALFFLTLGLLMPTMTYLLPYLLESLPGTGGIEMTIPPPTSNQALMEYSGNIVQMGVLLVVLLAMGAISKEVESGTATLLLSKPVSRLSFILAKLTAESLTLLVGLMIGGVTCALCTFLLFGDISLVGFALQTVLLSAFMVFCLAVTLYFSSLFRRQIAAGGIALVLIIVVALLGIIPNVAKFLPIGLINWGNNLVAGITDQPGWIALVVTIMLIGLTVFGSWLNLRRKEI